MKKVIVVPFVLLIALASCKKDSSTAANCDKTMANIAGTYTLVKTEVGTGGSFTDVTASAVEACERDDKLILNANGTTSYQDLGTVCSPNGNDTGTWTISSDGKMTINAGTTDISSAEISSFDCSTLVLTETDNSGGISTQYRITIRK